MSKVPGIAILLAALVACSSSSSSKGDAGSGGGASCSMCEDSTCGSEVSTCSADPDCKASIDCLSACNQSDLNCVGACPHPATTAGQNELDPVLNCWCGSCASQCGLMQGYGVCK